MLYSSADDSRIFHWLENHPPKVVFKKNRLLFFPIAINILIFSIYILVSTTVLADARTYELRDSFSQFKNEYNQYEVISIDSFNPVLAVHILNKDYLKAPVKIDGALFMPLNINNVPVVMFMMDSGGPWGFLNWVTAQFWGKVVKLLNKNGIGVLFVDSFTARGVTSTYADQSRLSSDGMVIDALMAFKYLASDSRVDPDKIAISGHSKGAGTSIAATDRRYTDAVLGEGKHFAASIPMAAACDVMLFENPKPSEHTNYLIFHGLADDYTPAKFCIEYAKKMEAAGANVKYELREDWYHGFYFAEMERDCNSCVVFFRCPVKPMFDDNGYVQKEFYEYAKNVLKLDTVKLSKEIENDLGTKTPLKTFAKIYYEYFSECGNMGTTVGGWHGDRAASILTKFLFQSLK